jgi:predicted DNA-binding ribbon-helix-helix protein
VPGSAAAKPTESHAFTNYSRFINTDIQQIVLDCLVRALVGWSKNVDPESIVSLRPDRAQKSDRSSLEMHNVYVAGNRTTVRLEPIIWDALQSIARQEEASLHDLISEISRRRTTKNLSSAIRAYVVAYLLTRSLEEFPNRAP